MALAALHEDKNMAELCKDFELHPTQINEWKCQLLDRPADAFGAGSVPELVELAPLHAKIGLLALENDFWIRAHQGEIAESKAMIDREHPLSAVRQARLLEISRGAVYYH